MTKDIRAVAQAFASGDARGIYELISLSEFKDLYRGVEAFVSGKLETDILLLAEKAVVKFSSAPDATVLIQGKKPKKKDFDFVLRAHFSGNVKPISLLVFMYSELRQNGLILALSGFTLWALLLQYTDYSTVVIVNQMIVDATAVFVSIFILFTISQNREPHSTKDMIEKGYTHQLIQNDNYMTHTAILSLVLAIISSAMLGEVSGHGIEFLIPFLNVTLVLQKWATWLTAVAFVLLLDCLLSITRYYLRIARTEIEGKMYQEVLGNSRFGKSTQTKEQE